MANMLRSYIVKPPRVGMGAVSALGDTLEVGREDLAGVLRRGILLLRSNILLLTVDFNCLPTAAFGISLLIDLRSFRVGDELIYGDSRGGEEAGGSSLVCCSSASRNWSRSSRSGGGSLLIVFGMFGALRSRNEYNKLTSPRKMKFDSRGDKLLLSRGALRELVSSVVRQRRKNN